MPPRKGGQFAKGNVPHNAKEARMGGDEEDDTSVAGAVVEGDVSMAAIGQKLDDVAATGLLMRTWISCESLELWSRGTWSS